MRLVTFARWRRVCELIQEAQLMLTTGSTRLAVSRGQQTWYHNTCYIIVSYCTIVTLSLGYSSSKKFMTLKWGQRSLKVIESDIIRQIVYGFLLVFFSNLSLKCTVFEIFDFKNAVTLKTGLGVRQGHWKCHHVTEHL